MSNQTQKKEPFTPESSILLMLGETVEGEHAKSLSPKQLVSVMRTLNTQEDAQKKTLSDATLALKRTQGLKQKLSPIVSEQNKPDIEKHTKKLEELRAAMLAETESLKELGFGEFANPAAAATVRAARTATATGSNGRNYREEIEKYIVTQPTASPADIAVALNIPSAAYVSNVLVKIRKANGATTATAPAATSAPATK